LIEILIPILGKIGCLVVMLPIPFTGIVSVPTISDPTEVGVLPD